MLGELLLWLVYQLTHHVAVANKLLGLILTRQRRWLILKGRQHNGIAVLQSAGLRLGKVIAQLGCQPIGSPQARGTVEEGREEADLQAFNTQCSQSTSHSLKNKKNHLQMAGALTYCWG